LCAGGGTEGVHHFSWLPRQGEAKTYGFPLIFITPFVNGIKPSTFPPLYPSGKKGATREGEMGRQDKKKEATMAEGKAPYLSLGFPFHSGAVKREAKRRRT